MGVHVAICNIDVIVKNHLVALVAEAVEELVRLFVDWLRWILLDDFEVAGSDLFTVLRVVEILGVGGHHVLEESVLFTLTFDDLAIFAWAFVSEQVFARLMLLLTPAALAVLLGSWSLFGVDLDHIALR